MTTPDAKSSQYTVLARRFRPQAFSEVVGQQHIAQALRNAIQQGRVAHAYLFTGARGVGKTSTARILAKALNCPYAKDGIPCNDCEICRGISAGNDVDVLEIDGASNRGIDDIRALRANVNVKSMRTRYKVYIIDEVHMLTKEAFNALLKTLEEPPPSVKFVFCTTEPNKVPDTILSRCQRFDFATIETQNIIGRLQQIAEAEGYVVEPDALELVARRANGSMRDSQSLFDQLLSFGEERITADDVHRLIGTASDERLIELADALIDRRRDAVLQQFDAALVAGVQLGELIDQLLNYLRDLMILASGAEGVPLLAVSLAHRERLKGQAERWGLHTVMAALQLLAEAKGQMFRASFARALAEMALVRISLLEDLQALGQLIHDLKQGRPPAGGGPALPARPSSAPTPAVTVAPSPATVEKKKLNGAPPPALAASPPAEPTAAGSAAVPAASGAGETPALPATSSSIRNLRPGREMEFWSEVLAGADVTLRNLARGVQRSAILGPNHLELFFSRAYDFCRQNCERPDVRSRLETLAAQVAGQPVRLTFSQLDGDQPAPSIVEPDEDDHPPADQAPDDPFVTQAMELFGGTVVKVERLTAPAATEEA